LAKALLRAGSEEEARQYLRRALQSEPQTEDDPALLEECQKLLRKLEN
jgi:Tfp pilus assembly protein PilF